MRAVILWRIKDADGRTKWLTIDKVQMEGGIVRNWRWTMI
jgi:hypothetical protein